MNGHQPIQWCNSVYPAYPVLSCLRVVYRAPQVEAHGVAALELLKQKEKSVKIAVVSGSTRARRNSEAVARWVYELARAASSGLEESVARPLAAGGVLQGRREGAR
jgi:hypothetical protein